MPKCKACKKAFNPQYPKQACCSIRCAIELSKIKDEVQKQEMRHVREWKKAKKTEHKKHGHYESDLQTEINAIIRIIDKGQYCISHQGPGKKINAGHYHSVGANNSIRFNLLNIWLQCESCNGYKSSNRSGYDVGLVAIFGQDHWLYINQGIVRDYPIIKMSIPELIEKTKLARSIKNRLLANPPLIMSDEDRWRIREEINEEIGIYHKSQFYQP
jgi:hypothetical protein